MGNAPLDQHRSRHHSRCNSEYNGLNAMKDESESDEHQGSDGEDVDVGDDEDDNGNDNDDDKANDTTALAEKLKSMDSSSTTDMRSDKEEKVRSDNNENNNNNTNNQKAHHRSHKRSITLPTYIRRRSSLLLSGAKNRLFNSKGDNTSLPSTSTGNTASTTTTSSTANSNNNSTPINTKTQASAIPSTVPALKLEVKPNSSNNVESKVPFPPLPPKLNQSFKDDAMSESNLTLFTDKINQENSDGIATVDYTRQSQKASICSQEATQIRPYLYLSGDLVAKNKEQLRNLKVTNIINAAKSICENYFEKDGSIEYLSFDLLDSPDEQISNFFLITIAEIEKVRKKSGVVLIHCQQGVSRSTSLILAYIMWADRVSYEQAFDSIKQMRSVCSPNFGFTVQLKDWEKLLASPPPRPLFFRVGPHSDKERTLVARPMMSASAAFQPANPTGIATPTSSTPSPQSKARVGFADAATIGDASSLQQGEAVVPSTPNDATATTSTTTPFPPPLKPSGSILRRSSLTSQINSDQNQTPNVSSNQTPMSLGMMARRSRLKSLTVKPPVKFQIQNMNTKEVYILCVTNPNINFIWIGKTCPKAEEYSAAANKISSLMIDLVPTLKGYRIVKVHSQSIQEAETMSSSNNKEQKNQGDLELIFWNTLDGIEVSESELSN